MRTGLAAAAIAVAALATGCGSSSAAKPTSTSAHGGTSSTAQSARTTAQSQTSTGTASMATATGTTSAAASGIPASGPGSPGHTGPEGIPIESGAVLAPASSTRPGTTVDGIQCAPIEQLAYHIHAHLQVYVDGQPRALPAAIGLIGPVSEQTEYGPFWGAQKCYYWLHTHAQDGVIHIESPTARVYTLGDFFDEWNQPLSSKRVASAKGTVSALVNGKPWTKSVRAIPLKKHAVIQLAVGQPVPPSQRFSWGKSTL